MIRNTIYTLFVSSLGALVAPAAQAATLDDLFNDNVVHEVRLTLHAADWQKLRVGFLDDTYYPAVFQWNDQVIEDIGIRSRGNGSRHPDKPGLRIDFNRYAAGQEFLGLKSLVLDNLTQDQTMMAERISMQVFRRMGLPAPRVAHARLLVNGALVGLYTIVEPVDKGFLKRNLGEDGGYLYDYEWAFDYNFEYLGPDGNAYSPIPFQPQTNESNPDPAPIERMLRAINESTDEAFLDAVSQYLDLKLFLDYLAVETYLGETDGLLGTWGVNNFYLYRLKGRNLSILIPWDKDVTLRAVDRSIWENVERNVLTRRLLAIPDYRDYYLSAIERTSSAVTGWLGQEVEREYEQIRSAAAEDPNKPFTYGQFEEGMWLIRTFAEQRASFIANEIAAAR
jgi:spore coat protein CotH